MQLREELRRWLGKNYGTDEKGQRNLRRLKSGIKASVPGIDDRIHYVDPVDSDLAGAIERRIRQAGRFSVEQAGTMPQKVRLVRSRLDATWAALKHADPVWKERFLRRVRHCQNHLADLGVPEPNRTAFEAAATTFLRDHPARP